MTNRIILEVYQDVTIQVLIYLSKAYYFKGKSLNHVYVLAIVARLHLVALARSQALRTPHVDF